MRFFPRRLIFLSPPTLPQPHATPSADTKPFFGDAPPTISTPPSAHHQGQPTTTTDKGTTTPVPPEPGPSSTTGTRGTRHNCDACSSSGGAFYGTGIASHLPKFLSSDGIIKRVAASIVGDTFHSMSPNGTSSVMEGKDGEMQQRYAERCVLGWSPRELYEVVADVAQYSTFLPWCLESTVHQVRPLGVAAGTECVDSSAVQEMLATLAVGFSFFKEQYTSRVILEPQRRVEAMLTEEEQRRRTAVLRNLRCTWEFREVPDSAQKVEVQFLVSFAFKNPIYSELIMSHVVSIMTKSFEKRCEALHGPPSCKRQRLQ
uniref:Coenzyme Q-binding protein COQ10 START domain-containing protein n=1 Tax=Trypanosoma congolense (strain IL3000) TaxID=1068625 RepID=G0USD0_TRYCI|nr:conserved hypothetical protein [Trypanosoma congolense IL3000]